ncbi:hypothetical protein [Halosegnis sp.]|uniref:hypothetical protein n=1 Tax=Halosegnis sp. TaxID=2864959 RepID=UPI0035D51C6F
MGCTLFNVERQAASVGASIGATLGAKSGPVSAGLGAGFGAAGGYIAGALANPCPTLLTDGGEVTDEDRTEPATDPSVTVVEAPPDRVEIPVTEA